MITIATHSLNADKTNAVLILYVQVIKIAHRFSIFGKYL